MKTRLYNIYTLFLFGAIIMCMVNCTNNDSEFIQEDIVEESEIGNLHNEVISNIFECVSSAKSRSGAVTISEFKTACIEEATLSVIAKDSQLQYDSTKATIAAISSQPVQVISDSMSVIDRAIINYVKIMLKNEAPTILIKSYINKNCHSDKSKKAALNFVDTYLSSKEYWAENGSDWVEYVDAQIIKNPETASNWYEDIRWGEVVLSDAYYAWYWTISSGGNLYVGAGASAVGSAASILNQL